MTDSQDAIRRLSIKADTVGVDSATAQLNKLADAQSGVAVASTTTEKATLSLDQKFANIERRYVASVRAQQDFEKTQRLVNQAVSQNPALQDRANVILAAAKDRHDQLTNSQKALSVVTQDLNSRIQAAGGGFGVFGQAISALGPIGIGVAAVLGTLTAGFVAASNGAHDLATKSRELKDFSESTGLTTSQVQALRSEATRFGIDSDVLQSGLQKFTTGFQELRLGSGDLLTQIRRINPALAEQMMVATDTASAFTLFGKAVAQTTNIFERNALARSGLGKGGPSIAQFLGSVGDVNALTAAYESAGKGLKSGLIDKTSELELQIAKTSAKAKENLSSIFAEDVLKSELQFANGLLTISEAVKEFKLSEGLKSFINFVTNPITLTVLGAIAAAGAAAAGLTVGGVALAVGGAAALAGATAGAVKGVGSSASEAPPTTQNRGPSPNSSQPVTDLASSPKGDAKTPEALAADMSRLFSVLGSAASPAERLNAQIAELGIRAKEAGVSADDLARGVSGLKLDAAIAQQSAHNSALGALASETDIVKQKTLELSKAQQQGAGLTKTQTAAVINLTKAQDELSRIQSQAQIGVFNLGAATAQAGKELQSWIDRGLLDPRNPEQMAAAQEVLAKRIRDTGDAAALAGSKLPQLTQLSRDAGNLDKQIDSFATGSLNNFSDALVSIANGSATAGSAFKSFGLQVVSALEKMIIQMTIIKPLADSLGGGFSSLFGGGTPSNFIGPVLPSAHGNAFDLGNVIPFARGGVVDSPTIAPMALFGEAGPEAIVPLRRGPDGNLGVASAGGGGSPSISIGDVYVTVPEGTSPGNAGAVGEAVKSAITQVVDDRISYHSRPRGMLNRAS